MPRKKKKLKYPPQTILLDLIKEEYQDVERFANRIGLAHCTLTQYISGRIEAPKRAKRHLALELTGEPDWDKIFISGGKS